MRYTMKSGMLMRQESDAVLARIRNALTGSVRIIRSSGDQRLMEAQICTPESACASDVRNKEYRLLDCSGCVAACAFPGYAQGEEPETAGWPIHRMPRVDHAKVIIDGAAYRLTMRSSRRYTLEDSAGKEIVRIVHNGLAGGWTMEDDHGFRPEILCGLFVFCRYIELENEFMTI